MAFIPNEAVAEKAKTLEESGSASFFAKGTESDPCVKAVIKKVEKRESKGNPFWIVTFTEAVTVSVKGPDGSVIRTKTGNSCVVLEAGFAEEQAVEVGVSIGKTFGFAIQPWANRKRNG